MNRTHEQNYRYLRQDLPNIQDRRDYCERVLARSVKLTKDSPLHSPIAIRIEPTKDTRLDLVFWSLVVDSMSAGVLYRKLRQKIKLSKTQGLYLYCGDLLVMYNTDLSSLYQKKKQADGFIYITYGQINPF